MTSRSLQNYYTDEFDKVDGKSKENTKKTDATCKSSRHRANSATSTILKCYYQIVTIRLKSLSKFWISFHLLLINYEVELDLSWTKDCVLTEHHYNITGVSYKITSSKFHVSAVTLSINDNIKVLENLKRKLKKTIFWNKYRYEITAQRKNNNLHCIIDPPFTNINSCLFFVH